MSLLLLLVVSWCGAASLQQLDSTAEPHDVDIPLYPLSDSRSQFDPYDNSPLGDGDFYRADDFDQGNQNYGSFYSTNDANQKDLEEDGERNHRWLPNIVDTDKTLYIKVNGDKEGASSFISEDPNDAPDATSKAKRSFSPWGGKRSKAATERNRGGYIWSWKRTPRSKDSNMPKRVRFSPWGGKRSGNVIFKPSKASKIIYSSLTPELWMQQLYANSPAQRLNKGSFPFKSSFKKKYQLLKFKRNEYELLKRNRLPLYDFSGRSLNSLELSSKKDGKRKVKFSAWGGKRSPPIIGPVWTPSTENSMDKLNSILLVKDDTQNNRRLKL